MTKLNKELFIKFYNKKNELENFRACDLADEFNVSPSQISKFAQKLGYTGYSELKWKTVEGKGIFNVLERIQDELNKLENEIKNMDLNRDINDVVNFVYNDFYDLLEMVQKEKNHVCEIIEIFIINVLELIRIGNKKEAEEADKIQLVTSISNNIFCIKLQIQKLT